MICILYPYNAKNTVVGRAYLSFAFAEKTFCAVGRVNDNLPYAVDLRILCVGLSMMCYKIRRVRR